MLDTGKINDALKGELPAEVDAQLKTKLLRDHKFSFADDEVGSIIYDFNTQRSYVLYRDNRIYRASDILKAWFKSQYGQQQETYTSPFTGKKC